MSMGRVLQTAINKWLDGKSKRSLSMLARLSKVSYSTLRRVIDNENEPSAETALKIADVVMTNHEFKQFVAEYLPSLSKARADIAYKSGELDDFDLMADVSLVPVLLLASHRHGTNEQEVQAYFGKEKAMKFMELVDRGTLEPLNGGNWKLTRDLGSVNLDTAREWLGAMTGLCGYSRDELPRASLAHVGWESLSFEAALDVYHAAVDFVRKATEIAKDQANQGDILVFYGSLFNVLKGEGAYK